MLDPSQIGFALAACLAAMAVGLSKGGLPMIGLLAVPIMSLVMSPLTAAGLLLPVYVVSDMFGVWNYRREYSGRNLAILMPAGALGVGIGWATASVISEEAVMLMVGLIGLAFCLNRWFGRLPTQPRPADVPRGLFWGTLTGFTSFVTHAGAPPYQTYMLPQRLPKMVFAGTSTLLFAAINAMKLVPYWALGQLSLSNLTLTLAITPVAVAGTFAGVKLTRIIPEKLFFRLVIGALFLLSLKLVMDGVVHYARAAAAAGGF
ncbi:sulfite exporter TauE/SafE family protein [Ancylobacter oerskovii]|uniref:Probable membrane transporter protein n=1 Tax=Ancylobacter oerskovii TaxID=459519 RepID=A0ABW4YV89_9HYPH|nr:sulfite exporter TauE/SafE family protein [Ancylobacter oerskovii]MBS7543150.1 sulfite exporter TauE/SafE family protein [Ancylobacter oerskovii]